MGGTGGSSHTRPRSGSTRDVGGEIGGTTGITGSGATNRCQLIDESVRLSSPKPNIVAKLSVGDILKLSLSSGAPPILAKTEKGDVAGAVVPSSLDTLLNCMGTGFTYIATVESLKGGICIVRITPS